MPNEITVVFCNGSNYDYYFIVKELANEFEGQFERLGENDTNKFILLLRKGVYPYEYMDDWEKFNETTLSEQKDF